MSRARVEKKRKFKERENKEAQVSVAAAIMPDAIPDGFECPISQEIMVDPVITVADGHSYERRCIETWLKTRKKSPMTGAPLSTPLLVPNHNLRKAIQHFLKQQPAFAQLKEQERQRKTQEQVLKDLELAIQLREQDLAANLAQKAEVKELKPVPIYVASPLTPEQLKSQVAEFIKALDQHIKVTPRFQFGATAAASYASTVVSCFAKEPAALQAMLDKPQDHSLPEGVAKFISQYLAQHPELHGLRQQPGLTQQLKVELAKAESLPVLLQQLGLSEPATLQAALPAEVEAAAPPASSRLG